jgi:hypothetical protein
MQADSPASGNLVEYWTAGIRRGFGVVILIVLLLIVGAQVTVFMAMTHALSPVGDQGGWGFIPSIVLAFFVLLPLGFAGGVLAAWLIGRRVFPVIGWGSLIVLVPLGAPPANLYLARVIGEHVVPLLSGVLP